MMLSLENFLDTGDDRISIGFTKQDKGCIPCYHTTKLVIAEVVNKVNGTLLPKSVNI